MRAHGNEGRLGRRFAIVIGVAAAGVMAASASADFKSVHDPRGDMACVHEAGPQKPCSHSDKRNADIVRATAGHEGGRLRHTIRVVGKIEWVGILFNTDSDPECETRIDAVRGGGKEVKFRKCGTMGFGTGRARVDFHRHSVETFFRERSIGNPDGYGWNLGTNAGPSAGHANDEVRRFSPPHYIRHELG